MNSLDNKIYNLLSSIDISLNKIATFVRISYFQKLSL